jgi:hypothetical protein
MEPDEARAAIDGWFRDRSTDDATALDAFRVVALSDRTSAVELAELRLRFVDYRRDAGHRTGGRRQDRLGPDGLVVRRRPPGHLARRPRDAGPGPHRRNRGGLRGVRDRRRLGPAAPHARARFSVASWFWVVDVAATTRSVPNRQRGRGSPRSRRPPPVNRVRAVQEEFAPAPDAPGPRR